MNKLENLECPECWGTIPHPGDAHCIPDARVELLHKLAHAMMVVELQRRLGTLEDALRVPAEAQRTYKRLLSSREAMKLLAQIEMCGLCLVANPRHPPIVGQADDALTPPIAKVTPPKSAKDEVCTEILRIMHTYREQELRGYVDTPGGLEHMGDVWMLFGEWESRLLSPPIAEVTSPVVKAGIPVVDLRMSDRTILPGQPLRDASADEMCRCGHTAEYHDGGYGDCMTPSGCDCRGFDGGCQETPFIERDCDEWRHEAAEAQRLKR